MNEIVVAEVIEGDIAVTDDPWPLYVHAWVISHDSEHTRKAYRIDVDQWTKFCARKGVHPLAVKRAVLDTWKNELRECGGHAGRPAATKTINRKLSAVASLYTYLVHEDVLPQSPAAHIKRPKVSDGYQATAALDEEQAERLLQAAQTLGDLEHAAVRILMFSGIRAAELLAADADHVMERHGHVILKLTRKGNKTQEIPLSPATGRFVLDYLGGRRQGPLLRDAAGARVEYWPLYHMVAKAGRRAGIKGMVVSPHVLRATFGTTYLNQEGAQIDRLQDIFGHADGRTTKLYDRGARSLDRMASVMEVVEKRIAGASAA